MGINRAEMQEAIKCPEWQRLREAMKGRPTIIKLQLVKGYVTVVNWRPDSKSVWLGKQTFSKECCSQRARQVQVINYLTALSRGGLIEYPKAWQFPEHVHQWLTTHGPKSIKGEG